MGDEEYILSHLGFHKNEINEELKIVGLNDLEDMVFRMLLTYNEIENLLDMEYIDAKSAGYIFHQVYMKFMILT